jgi:hypothetical protein
MFRWKTSPTAVLAVALALVMTSPGRANVTLTGSGTNGGDGPIAGSVTFTAGAGVLIITITNTENSTFNGGTSSNPGMVLGQGISEISFTFNAPGGVSQPSAFASISGTYLDMSSANHGDTWGPGSTTLGSGTPFGPVSPTPGIIPPQTHWVYHSPTDLITAGSNAGGFGGAPDMIFPSAGTVEDGLNNNTQNPLYVGPTTFVLTVAGMTSSTDLTNAFSNVKLGFGTSPDTHIVLTPQSVDAVPEPSTMLIAAVGAIGFVGYGVRRLKKDLHRVIADDSGRRTPA